MDIQLAFSDLDKFTQDLFKESLHNPSLKLLLLQQKEALIFQLVTISQDTPDFLRKHAQLHQSLEDINSFLSLISKLTRN